MELKKGEKIIKQGNVRYKGDSLSMPGWSGILYLTNKRLFLEYYGFIPANKTEIEIPLDEITGAKKAWFLRPYLFKVEYQHGGEPKSIIFAPSDSMFGWNMMKTANEWIAQIQNSIKKR